MTSCVLSDDAKIDALNLGTIFFVVLLLDALPSIIGGCGDYYPSLGSP
jgi:hypothetical protein